MKYQEIKAKTKDQLYEFIFDAKKELLGLRLAKSNGQLEKTHRVRELRRGIAKAMTHLNKTKEI